MLRSTVLRLAVGYAALFAGSALLLAGYIYWTTERYFVRQTEKTVVASADALLERFRGGGIPALARAIEARLADEADDDEILALVDESRRVVAGNLEGAPAAPPATWFDLEILRRPVNSTARMLRLPVGEAHVLYVGRDNQVRLDMRKVVADSLAWSIAMTVALSILVGFLARHLLARRLARISGVADRVVLGDLSTRVKLTGAGDEFDRLSGDINLMLDRISELMDGVRQVSNAIAHDLRTPLARLRGRLEAALRDSDSPVRFRATAEAALQELDQVVRIFEALLRIAEIEAGHRRAAFAPVDAAALAADVAELYQPLAEQRGLALEAGLAPATCTGDRTLVAQALANLVDNAIKHARPGGHVRVRSATREGNVELVVEDDGPGIPEGERDKVVRRFYRLEPSRGTPGSGLGLSLVVSVARLHGGRLELEDAAPGLRARLVLPANA
ncbi:MAG: sensor histidine kinase [Alphaproteobacteria bacterium]